MVYAVFSGKKKKHTVVHIIFPHHILSDTKRTTNKTKTLLLTCFMAS